MDLPDIGNRMNINETHINATPKGYALRILKSYRRRCDEHWIVDGISEDRKAIWEKMNETQIERAKELDKAIEILKKELGDK